MYMTLNLRHNMRQILQIWQRIQDALMAWKNKFDCSMMYDDCEFPAF